MGVVQLPDDLKQVIDRQVAAGRVPSEAAFLSEAIREYAATLEADDEIVAAVDEGIADIEAGRFELIATPEDMTRLRAVLSASRLKQVPP